MKIRRSKYDYVIIFILIASALLVGTMLGYEKGVSACKANYNKYISRMCICVENQGHIHVSKSIPEHYLSDVLNISKK
jgi:hypothetical protein